MPLTEHFCRAPVLNQCVGLVLILLIYNSESFITVA